MKEATQQQQRTAALRASHNAQSRSINNTDNDDTTGTIEERNMRMFHRGPDLLRCKHPHPRDDSIRFEEKEHRYSVDWDNKKEFTYDRIISVSKVYKDYFSEFDADAVITKMMESKKWPQSKYYGLDAGQIKLQWSTLGNAASAAGSAHHLICESYYNGMPPASPHTKVVGQFMDFAKDHDHLTPFRTEWVLRSNADHLLCGTPDMIFVSPNHRPDNDTLLLSVYDWKNSKKIQKFNPWDKGTVPFADLPDCNYFHYAIQLNIYKYILENFYAPMTVDGVTYSRIKIDKMFLVVMHDNRDKYLKLLLPNYQDRIKLVFENRKQELVK